MNGPLDRAEGALAAVGPGILLVLVLWALWYLVDPPIRPEGVSWPRLVLWLFTPLGLYLYLAKHKEPPSEMGSPKGAEGRVSALAPLEVEVLGSFWQARCRTRDDLRIGERVRVLSREGLTLIVERLR
jgi:membrane protein implicated in regulation of membrane protease activity